MSCWLFLLAQLYIQKEKKSIMPDRTPGTLSAVLSCKCPRCRTGEVFAHNATNLTKFAKTNKRCPHCNLLYEVEPGFFYGAMYVSYAFAVAQVIIVGFLVNYLLDGPSANTIMLYVVSFAVVTAPLVFRYSRVIYLYLFSGVNFDKRYMS